MPTATAPARPPATSQADSDGMPPRPWLARRVAAKGLAAFALVFAGCGAIVANAQYDEALGAVGVSLVLGSSTWP